MLGARASSEGLCVYVDIAVISETSSRSFTNDESLTHHRLFERTHLCGTASKSWQRCSSNVKKYEVGVNLCISYLHSIVFIMKRLRFIVPASVLVGSVDSVSSNCRGAKMSLDWYYDLIFCGLDAGSTALTASTLNACVTGTLTDGPTVDDNLDTMLTTASDACTACAVTFANAVRVLRSDTAFNTACVDTWMDSQSETDVRTLACLDVLYEPISAFNACTGNGYDLATAESSVRCTTDEFVDIEKEYRPWGPIVAQALRENVDTDEYAALISAAFATHLGEAGCGACFDTLFDGLQGLGADLDDCEESAFSSACLSTTSAVRSAFALCTGGHAINVKNPSQCTAAEGELFDTVYRPYFAYMSCAAEGGFFPCVEELNGIEDTPKSACDSCYGNLQVAMAREWVDACDTSPLGAACVAAMNAKDGPLRSFAVCSGFEMNSNPTACSTAERAGIHADFKSFIPMLIVAKYSADFFSAGNLLGEAPELANLSAAVAGLTCESCYRAFIAGVYERISTGGVIDCDNAYSDECLVSIADIALRFRTCSGITLTAVSANLCSADEFAAILAAGLTGEMLTLALSAESVDAMLVDFEALLEDNASLAIPCSLCFSELLRAIEALSADDKLVCANISTDACTAILETPLAAFEECSGSAFVSESVTVTTTAAPETTTTVAPTTTKSGLVASVLVASVLALISSL